MYFFECSVRGASRGAGQQVKKKQPGFRAYLVDRLAIGLGNKHLGGLTDVDTIEGVDLASVVVWRSSAQNSRSK